MGVLMLQSGELGLLQIMLHSIPELQLSEQRFRELKQIFVSYDKDSTGQLDAEEFISVLKASGWEENEAENAYVELAPDGKSGITFDKFEGWWRNELLGLNKQKKAIINPLSGYDVKCDTTFSALRENLGEMSEYLERQGREYSELSSLYSQALDKLKSGRYASCINRDNSLIMPSMAPSLTALLEKVSLRLQNDDDVKGALRLMHDILMDNKAVLDRDPGLFVLPDDDASFLEQCSTLASWMDSLGRVLRYQKHAKANQQVDYLRKTSRGLVLRDALDRNSKSMKKLRRNVSTMDGFSLEAEGSGGLIQKAQKQVSKASSNLLSSNEVIKAIKATTIGADGMLTMGELREAQISLAGLTAQSRQRTKQEQAFLSSGIGAVRAEFSREVREEKQREMNKASGDELSPLARPQRHSMGGELTSRSSKQGNSVSTLDTTFKPPSLADLRARIIAESISRRDELLEGMSSMKPKRMSTSGFTSTEEREAHLRCAREADASKSLGEERSSSLKRTSMSGAGRTIVTLPSLNGSSGGPRSSAGGRVSVGGGAEPEMRLPVLSTSIGADADGGRDSPRPSLAGSRFSRMSLQQF